MTTLFIDLETFSEVPISYGTYKYAENAEVMLLAFAIDDGPATVIDLTSDVTSASEVLLRNVLAYPDRLTVIAHNAMFDRNALRLGNQKLDIPIRHWECSMAKAYAHSLPGSLDKLCDVLKLPIDKQKLKDGHRLVLQFCKPRPKNQTLRRATRHTHPADWEAFKDYARLDVEAMREVYKRTPSWNWTPEQIDSWHLDQEINDRGYLIDLDLVRGAIDAVDKEQTLLARRTQELTLGDVERASQRDQMLAHILSEYGVTLPDMTASTLERRIDDPELPSALRELLNVRLQTTTTSTSKYRKMLQAVDYRGRACGTLQWCGAQRTGRWSGRTIQPQNYPRPNLKQAVIDEGIEAIKAGCAHLIYDNVMELTSNAIRGTIVASPGKQLYVADLSNIEGRIAAWLGGERWKLDAFRAYDLGAGPDLYKVAYGRTFGVAPETVTKDQRQIGKVLELAMGYEGGVGAFVTFAAAYNVDLNALASAALAARSIPVNVWEEASAYWDRCKSDDRPTFGLRRETFITCDSFKRLWRAAHPGICALWRELSDTIRLLLAQPGEAQVGGLTLRRVGSWLRIVLQSGRQLSYPAPRIEDGTISYMGINQYSRQWQRLQTYGGKVFENCVQAIARDVMLAGMYVIREAGFDILLTVHDEVISEREPGIAAEDYAHLMTTVGPEYAGLPLAAGGFVCERYRKE